MVGRGAPQKALTTTKKGKLPIAIYHLSIKIITRGIGKSAVGAAAYRAGEKITNERDGITHDYTRKPGILHTEILLPSHAPLEYADRPTLWNAVEKIERNKNSQLSREIQLALPVELSAGQNISLVHEYCNEHFVSKGMCADICIHNTGTGNPHAHIMLTVRPFNEDKTWGAKSKKEYILDDNGERILLKSGEYKSRKVSAVDWNEQCRAEEWRQGWADCVNRFLENNHIAERIDHRSYSRQGVEQVPTIHLGVSAHQMEKKGIRTERGDINRAIEVTNKELRQLRVRIKKLKSELGELLSEKEPQNIPQSNPAELNIMDALNAMLSSQEGKTRLQKISTLKVAADAFNYLQTHNISTLPQLYDNLDILRNRYDIVNDKIKKSDRRLKVLNEHIKQAEIYKEYSAIYRQYKQQNPKNQDAFYESNNREITLYEAAERYLRQHLNGRDKIPLISWQKEAQQITAERKLLQQDFYKLKDDVRQVGIVKASVEHIFKRVGEREQIRKPQRAQGMEL